MARDKVARVCGLSPGKPSSLVCFMARELHIRYRIGARADDEKIPESELRESVRNQRVPPPRLTNFKTSRRKESESFSRIKQSPDSRDLARRAPGWRDTPEPFAHAARVRCRATPESRRSARRQCLSSHSMPRYDRPQSAAATRVLPDPENGSR